MIADSLPYWPVNPLLTTSPWHIFQLDMVRCLWAMLPPTILWGASFPLALGAVASANRLRQRVKYSANEDSARIVGGVYAANTLGAIIGALVVSLILIPLDRHARFTNAFCCCSRSRQLAVRSRAIHLCSKNRRRRRVAHRLPRSLRISRVEMLTPVPGDLIAYGRNMPLNINSSQVLDVVEGRNSSVAITQWSDGAIEVDVNGHVEATTEPYDMKLQRMVGHLPALLHPNPKSVLGIGFGAGVSAGTFTTYPGIENITVCEIEPVIPPTSTKYFAQQDYDVMNNPRTHNCL